MVFNIKMSLSDLGQYLAREAYFTGRKGTKLYTQARRSYSKAKTTSRMRQARRKGYGRGKRSTRGQYGAVKGIKKQIKQLSRIAKADQGTLIYRQRQALSVTAAVQQSIFANGKSLNLLNQMEEVIAQLRYYDPSNPATLLVADGATGSFQKDFFFDLSHHKIIMTNNYTVPVRVRGYIFKVKEDTDLTPLVCFNNGLADVGNPSNTSTMVYPTDSNQLMEIWKIDKSCNVTLQPGQSKVMSITNKKFVYDPSISDNHTLSFQRSFDGCSFNLRVEGVLGHDLSLSEFGTLKGAVDVQIDSTWHVLYPAGADIKFIYINDLTDTFTNNGAIANKPVADVQAFSTS